MTLMTQTLPTIVGMGVVSRAADTVFGKKCRAKAKRKFPKVYRGKRGGKYIMSKGRKVYI